jgi:predicted O-methyltransferase YrrM
MTERLPDNLAILHEAFSKEAIEAILPGDTFSVGDVEFVCKYLPESRSDRFFIVKSLPLVERYREMCRGPWHGGVIVELGIAEGGSTALLALLAEPAKCIVVDREPRELPALREFVENHGLSDVVRAYYGVDQADRDRLTEIVDTELAGGRLDVVIDDCSHRLLETRVSFEALFPHLRPGGLYLIEDWNHDHLMREAFIAVATDPENPHHERTLRDLREALADPRERPRPQPLSRLAVELMLARAALGDAIESVTVDEFWITVRRGTAELDAETFRLDQLVRDDFGYLSTTS